MDEFVSSTSTTNQPIEDGKGSGDDGGDEEVGGVDEQNSNHEQSEMLEELLNGMFDLQGDE